MSYISENKRGIVATVLTLLVVAMLYLSFPATAYTVTGYPSSNPTYASGTTVPIRIYINKTTATVLNSINLTVRTGSGAIAATHTFNLATECTPNITEYTVYGYTYGYGYAYTNPSYTYGGYGYGYGQAFSLTCNYSFTNSSPSTTTPYYVDVTVNGVYTATNVANFTISSISSAVPSQSYPSATPTPTPAATPTPTPSAPTPTPTPTATPTPTPTATPSPTPAPLTDNVGYNRDMSVDSVAGTTTFSLSFTNDADYPINDFNVEENIPKSVAADVSELTFDPAPDEIVQADPVVAWSLDFAPHETKTIKYSVNKILDRSVLNQFSAPRVTSAGVVVTPTPTATATPSPTATATPTPGAPAAAGFDWTLPILLLVIIVAVGAYFYTKPKK